MKNSKAFTLVELLVAMSLALVLTLLIAGILRDTLHVWHYAEERTRVYGAARQIFTYLREDMEALYPSLSPSREILMLLDYDKSNYPRLRLVRRLPQDSARPDLRKAGDIPLAAGYDEYYNEPLRPEAKLRALGGLAEIIYTLRPSALGLELWRGVRAPIGGGDSFFDDNKAELFQQNPDSGYCLADNVLYLAIKCWSASTTTWDEQQSPESGGPSFIWDSTCARLGAFFAKNMQPDSLQMFPLKMQITLMLASNETPVAILAEELSPEQKTLRIKNATAWPTIAPASMRIVNVGTECMSYTVYENGMLKELSRGVLGTQAQNHSVGRRVCQGEIFTVTVFLPTYCVPWK